MYSLKNLIHSLLSLFLSLPPSLSLPLSLHPSLPLSPSLLLPPSLSPSLFFPLPPSPSLSLFQNLFQVSNDDSVDVRTNVCRALVMLLEVRANDMMPHMNAIIEVRITNKQLLYMYLCVLACISLYASI